MPVKKAPTKPVTPVRTPVINTSKISSMTIGDVLGKASKFNANQAVYVLLLISFAICGYLFGKMQGMESAKSDTNAVAAAPAEQEAQAPQAPTGPVDVENGHFPAKGDENAKVTIV